MIRNILVLSPSFGIEHILAKRGFHPMLDEPDEDPDCIFFMGGVDINPRLYGEDPIEHTQHPNNARDAREIAIYHKYKNKPKAGICRGAQLLNVLNGGSMIQHVNHHAGGGHKVTDIHGKETYVCSVHHQMMIPSKNSNLIAWTTGVATEGYTQKGQIKIPEKEPEVLFIPDDKALLFQAHPEFGPKSCTDYFFNLMEEYLG